MKQYLELLQTIKDKGTYKPAARENMPGTQSLFGYQFRHDLQDGFPLLTTKKMYWKGIVVELLWFLRGDTNIKFLVDNGVNIWNEDAYQYYLKTHKRIINSLPTNDPFVLLCNKPISFDEFIDYVKNKDLKDLKTFEKFTNYSYGDCGYQYGKVWRDWQTDTNVEQNVDQIRNVLNSLKNNPESRRHIITAVDPAHDTELALYWCHAMFQFNCRPLSSQERVNYALKNYLISKHEIMFDVIDNPNRELNQQLDDNNVPKYYLDCQLYQRSADVVLGVPFNIASYALLIHIFAKICNMIPGEFIHTFGDVHIYDNHKDAVEEQLTRTPDKLPTLKISDEENNWNYIRNNYNFSNLDFADFVIENYHPQSKIQAELSTGLVK